MQAMSMGEMGRCIFRHAFGFDQDQTDSTGTSESDSVAGSYGGSDADDERSVVGMGPRDRLFANRVAHFHEARARSFQYLKIGQNEAICDLSLSLRDVVVLCFINDDLEGRISAGMLATLYKLTGWSVADMMLILNLSNVYRNRPRQFTQFPSNAQFRVP
jgi:hypothetical protein